VLFRHTRKEVQRLYLTRNRFAFALASLRVMSRPPLWSVCRGLTIGVAAMTMNTKSFRHTDSRIKSMLKFKLD
jgi:hypothetical protein